MMSHVCGFCEHVTFLPPSAALPRRHWPRSLPRGKCGQREGSSCTHRGGVCREWVQRGMQLLSLCRGSCAELVASVWKPMVGHGGTEDPGKQCCISRSLAQRTRLVTRNFHLPVANRTRSLTQDGAVVFLGNNGVLHWGFAHWPLGFCSKSRYQGRKQLFLCTPSHPTMGWLDNALAGGVIENPCLTRPLGVTMTLEMGPKG